MDLYGFISIHIDIFECIYIYTWSALPHTYCAVRWHSHTLPRTAAHYQSIALPHTAARTARIARTLPCILPNTAYCTHSPTHCRTPPHALSHTSSRAHCCTLLHTTALSDSRIPLRALLYTIPSALPHTAAVRTATHCRSYCRTLPH
jgi:hypothetical protein